MTIQQFELMLDLDNPTDTAIWGHLTSLQDDANAWLRSAAAQSLETFNRRPNKPLTVPSEVGNVAHSVAFPLPMNFNEGVATYSTGWGHSHTVGHADADPPDRAMHDDGDGLPPPPIS